jgi:hypothetical protein
LHVGGRLFAGLIVAALLVPAGASAATTTPEVTTGAAADVTPTTATLTGSVDPNTRQTSYIFQYGPTSLYGATTPETSVGKGGKRVRVTVPISGLAPFTTYHYRVVAMRGGKPVRKGKDRTFKTKRQPLGLSLVATPNPIRPNAATTLSGNLSGTGNANRQIVLQANPWPYTQGFQNASNVLVTDANGNFNFPVAAVPFNTQYRVLMPQNQNVQSPIVAVSVTPKVTAHRKKVRNTKRGAIYKFSGTLTPAADGTPIAIQRLRKGEWRTISGTLTRPASGGKSRYSKRVRLSKSGRFRVFAGVNNGQYAPDVSKSFRIKHVR